MTRTPDHDSAARPVLSARLTQLVRVPHLRAFHRAIALAASGPPDQVRDTVVLVPTESAGDALRQTLEDLWLVEQWMPSEAAVALLDVEPPRRVGALVLPRIVTRSGCYELLHERLPSPPEFAGRPGKDVLFDRAAREAVAGGDAPPFTIRPGLVAEMLDLHDTLGRNLRSVEDFERLVGGSLEEGAALDRGAARLLQQTRFLAAAFRRYERLLADNGVIDERLLRRHLLDPRRTTPLRRVIVTVPDHAASPHGLWPADFDLLARLPGLERLVVVATERLLATGLLERLQDTLPGIDLVTFRGDAPANPTLVVPVDADSGWFVSRDREEELADCAADVRALLTEAEGTGAFTREPPDERRPGGSHPVSIGFVHQHPLPYLYLARQVLGASGVSWQAVHALPLAAEPFAAALDLVMTFATTGFARGAGLALLRAPTFRFEVDGVEPSAADVTACDRLLRGAAFLGGREGLAELEARESAPRALRALRMAADALAPLAEAALPSAHLAVLEAFIQRFERPPITTPSERELRTREAVLTVVRGLREAFARFGESAGEFATVAAFVRRRLEDQTCSPRQGPGVVHLVDGLAAPYGSFSHVVLAGVVEGEWPAPATRTVFYPAGLLRDLGWPPEPTRRAAARAAFDDLMALARHEVMVSTFALEDDAIVRASPLLEDLERTAIGTVPRGRASRTGLPALLVVPANDDLAELRAWAALRASRSPADAPAFRGMTGPIPARPYAVTSLDRYLQCPFKYFAAHVLRLEEEPDDRPGLTPLERGAFLHDVFHAFFERWHANGRGAIDARSLPDARTLFADVVTEWLGALPEAERDVERTRLVGSAGITGLGERAFRFEAIRPAPILERLLEFSLDGTYGEGDREIHLRGKADRIDLLNDGTLRLLDYKTGRASNARSTVQIPIYASCAETRLHGRHDRAWTVSEAGYLAFGREEPFVRVMTPANRDKVLETAGQTLVETVTRIESGAFPVAPAEPFNCTFCGYDGVCRKDYVDDV